jgi:hypothetical protein
MESQPNNKKQKESKTSKGGFKTFYGGIIDWLKDGQSIDDYKY